jgi:voltage-gated potassium channel
MVPCRTHTRTYTMAFGTRGDWFGTRAAVLLPSAVALLSMATGVANISVASATGPLGSLIPEAVQQTAGFTGTLTGFLMLLSTWGLRRGYRSGWIATTLLLPVTAVQGFVQGSIFSLPLVIFSVLSLPTMVLTRRRFDRSLTVSTAQLAAIAALVATVVYGTAGSWALRDQFNGIGSLVDAVYYTVVTATTVGYGDAAPLSATARLFGISLVVLGTASFALALGSVLGPAIEARLSHALGTMTSTQYDLLEDHLLVLGYGDLTEPLLEELLEANIEFVVVTDDSDSASELRGREIDVLSGDPSDEQPLHDAGIEHARAVVVATNDDAGDALAILTARELNPDLHIVGAATMRENEAKLRRAGADTVISPAVIGGHLLAQSALGDADTEAIAERLLGEDGI